MEWKYLTANAFPIACVIAGTTLSMYGKDWAGLLFVIAIFTCAVPSGKK